MTIDRIGVVIEPCLDIETDETFFSLMVYRERENDFQTLLYVEGNEAVTLYGLVTGQIKIPEIEQGTTVTIPKGE